MGFPGGSVGKESTSNSGDTGSTSSWVGKIPWRREWQPTPVFLPGKSQGQRSLEGYSPWGRKELDTAEHQHEHSNSHDSPNSSLRYRISLGDLMWPSPYLHFVFIPVIVLNYL